MPSVPLSPFASVQNLRKHNTWAENAAHPWDGVLSSIHHPSAMRASAMVGQAGDSGTCATKKSTQHLFSVPQRHFSRHADRFILETVREFVLDSAQLQKN